MFKQFRESKNMTQEEVAGFLGTSKQNYSRYESGKTEANYDTLIKLSQLYKVSINALLGAKDPGEIDLTNEEFSILSKINELSKTIDEIKKRRS